MAQQWTEGELAFLAQFESGTRPVEVYVQYREAFGPIRSYNSVQKKFRSLFFDEDPVEEVDVLDTWEDALDDNHDNLRVKDYNYDEATDEYIIPTKQGLLHVSGSRIRQLLEDYSNYGAKKTINQVAREFGWARHAVIQVLRSLGKTHDSAPFTDEQILEEPVEDLVKDLARKKEHRIIARASRAQQRKMEANAEKWRQVEQTIKEVFEQGDYSTIAPPPLMNLKKADTKFAPLIYHTDVHVGKLAHGWEYDRLRDVVLGTTERALAHVTSYGRPEKILTGVGGDWSNIDNPRNTTTRGTPQHSNARWYEIMHQANQLTVELINLMSTVAPVEVYTVPGNHDRMWSVMAGSWLAQLYRDSSRVDVHTFQYRHYIELGKTMIMLTHGDGAKPNQYPSLMAAEAAEVWGRTRHRYAYHGHLHHEVVKEHRGTFVTQMPSVCPVDDWHIHEGYVGNRRALTAHLHDYSAGRVAQFNIGVDKDNNILG